MIPEDKDKPFIDWPLVTQPTLSDVEEILKGISREEVIAVAAKIRQLRVHRETIKSSGTGTFVGRLVIYNNAGVDFIAIDSCTASSFSSSSSSLAQLLSDREGQLFSISIRRIETEDKQ